MIHSFDKKNMKKNYDMISLIPVNNGEVISKNVVNYLDFLSYRPFNGGTDEDIKDYIVEYYNNVLSKLDPEEVIKKIRFTKLVSDERCNSIAIRHIVSEWLNIFCDEIVTESLVIENGTLERVERPDIVKKTLVDTIKSSIRDMKGFETLRGLYLFEKSEKLLEQTSSLESLTGSQLDEIRNLALYLRGNAFECENEHKYKDIYVEKFMHRRYKIKKR